MMKKKRGNLYERFSKEQLSFFDLLVFDDEEGISKNYEREESSIVRNAYDSKQTRTNDMQFGERDERILQQNDQGTSFEQSDNKSDFIPGTIAEEELVNEPSEGNDNAMVDDSKRNDNVTSSRFILESTHDERLNIDKKIEKNIEAIKLLKSLEKDNRQATAAQQEIIAGFSGWGGCPHIFNESDVKYISQRNMLKDLLSIDEYKNAKSSTLTSFYTPLEVINNMYKILNRIGFEKGIILETSCGTGNFMGMMSDEMFDGSCIHAVELDPISAGITRQLYNKVQVQNKGLEETNYPHRQFDLVISNVPFGNFQVYDKDYSKYHFNIHNYFFVKALDKVRNGGLIAFITSCETMDGNNGIMEYINERADFLGAIRLPNSTFNQNGANTSITSDIIFLQRNDEKVVEHSIITEHVDCTEHRKINAYFKEHPEMVFGNIKERSNQFGGYELTCIEDEKNIHTHFDEVLNVFAETYKEKEEIVKDTFIMDIDIDHSNYPVNTFFIENDQLFYRDDEYYYPVLNQKDDNEILNKHGYTDLNLIFLKNSNEYNRIKAMVGIADKAVDVIDAQVNDIAEDEYLCLRNELNVAYDSFIKEFGALHKRTNLSLYSKLSDDNRIYLLESLEDYDVKTGKISKSSIFSERTIKAKVEIKSADNVLDALYLSLDNRAGIDLEYMAILTNKEMDEVKQELLDNKYVYFDPELNDLVLADEYLSGNIRKKLMLARENGLSNNVESLENVMPEQLGAEDITIQFGASWIPHEYIEEFVKQLYQFKDYMDIKTTYDKLNGQWVVEHPYAFGVASQVWGVAKSTDIDKKKRQPEYNGYDLVIDSLNSRVPTIRNYWDVWSDEKNQNIIKSEVNAERTAQARDLLLQLEEKWEDWVFQDIDRRENLVQLYNEKFNSVRLREFDGQYLTFPEMSSQYQLEPYQKNAVARIMDKNDNTLLWQNVGAGKTFEMVSAGMEMKRLGIRNKILYVVPNHLVNQWQNEFLQLYPRANLLVATKKDFAKEKRQAFVNKIATQNYDAIIMAHSSFGMISVSNEKQIEFEQNELDLVQDAIDKINSESGFRKNSFETKQVKMLERTKKALEAKIKRLTDMKRDNNLIPWEELGVDYLFVDESHEFKNLFTYTAMSNVVGLQNAASQKAQDMYLKTRIIEENGGGICFATGTPVTNTMAELYTLQRYLQFDRLHEMDIYCFDAWAKNFGKVINSFEISIDGSQFVTRSRFAKFFNVQELMTTFKEVSEIQTAGMLRSELAKSTTRKNLSLPPKHIGGKPTIVKIEPSEELKEYIEDIVIRTEAIHNNEVDRSMDNMLKVTSDSKKASIDMRLIDPSFSDSESSKLSVIAKNVFKVYSENKDDKATQLIFCDSSAPKTSKENITEGFQDVYHELYKKMVNLGIPSDEIAFIHDYNTESKKEALFKDMNSGKMRVLIGSTPKLGAGTNVQKRLIAIHHVDVPWRASDVEQQNGRAFRQGNMYDEIYEFRYVTLQSFDAYSWQIIETKSTYMDQLLSGAHGMREFEEDAQTSFSYAEVKAIASGNPVIKEKFEVDNRLRELDRLKSQWRKTKLAAQDTIVKLPTDIEREKKLNSVLSEEVKFYNGKIPLFDDLDNNFKFIDKYGRTYTTYKEAWQDIVEITKTLNFCNEVEVGTYLDTSLFIKRSAAGVLSLYIQTPARYFYLDDISTVPKYNFKKVIDCLNKLPTKYKDSCSKLEIFETNLKNAKELIEKDFMYNDEIIQLRKRQKEIDSILEKDKDEDELNSNESKDENINLSYVCGFMSKDDEYIEVFEDNSKYYVNNKIIKDDIFKYLAEHVNFCEQMEINQDLKEQLIDYLRINEYYDELDELQYDEPCI